MHPKYPNMFKEGYLGKIRIPNRIVMTGMGCNYEGEDFQGENDVAYYSARAKGGTGLVIMGAAAVSSVEHDPYPIFSPMPRLDNINKLPRLTEVAEGIQKFGAVAGIQLSGGLGQNTLDLIPGRPPLSASAVPCKLDPNVLTTPMTKEDIQHKVQDFARAASIVYQAGFEVIEIHCHSGYLMEQFLDKSTNLRTDEYGGTVENRFRFMRETLQAIREAVGDKVALGIRFSANHMAPGKITLEECIGYCKLAEEAGVDFLDIDAGSYAARQWVVPAEYVDSSILEGFAAEVKKNVTIPVIHAGGYQFALDCERALADGSMDYVGLARPLLADPDWARKVKTGREDEIRPCVKCLNCLCRVYTNKHEDCAVNPIALREERFSDAFIKVDFPKRVAVIGGGPAGMVTALVAKRRGHEVTILEKTDHLGGQLNLACKEKFKLGVGAYNKYLIRQLEIWNVPVKFNFDATVENVKELNPDVVVVATGADVYIPTFIPGHNKENVVTVRGLYDMDLTGNEKVVVIGGGLVGCETALGLAREGHKVDIVEMLSEENFLAASFPFRNLNNHYLGLMQELNAANVTIHTSTKVKSIEDDHVVCASADGTEFTLPRDIVLTSTGTRSVKPTGEPFDDFFPEVFYVGDCNKSGDVKSAAHQGFYTGLKI